MITLTSHHSPAGLVTIRRRRGIGSYVYEQGACSQSEADQCGVSLSSYIHALYGFLKQKQCNHVLMIGCGGGTLATLLARAGAQVTVVDVDPDSFNVASTYFHMPDDVRCVVGDGAAYLKQTGETFDAIVLDAYDGSRIPKQLTTPAFLRSVKARLSRLRGIFLANVYLHHTLDLAADYMVEAAFSHWPAVRLFDTRTQSSRNALVMAGDVTDLKPPTLQVYPGVGWTEIIDELKLMGFRESRLGGLQSARRLWERVMAKRFQADE